MSQLSQYEEKESTLQTSNANALPATPSPPLLQWVSVGEGGKVSSVSKIRSHVSREYHQRRRDVKRANEERLSHQQNTQLLPGVALLEHPTRSTFSRLPALGKGGSTATEEHNGPLARQQYSPSQFPSTVIKYHANSMIPYAWFEEKGPVLYVNRINWPFPAPLAVTASDRKVDNDKSVTPRQSGWMPYKRSPDYVPVKGAVLDARVLTWIGQTPECFQFRVDTIKWIQEQLGDPTTAISNSTIGAIMTFAMWTAGYSEPIEMDNHMNAIERIVNLRGGFHTFQNEGTMIEKLTLFDSMIAVQTGKPKRFPPVDYFISRPITPRAQQRLIYYNSPLFGPGNFEAIAPQHKDRDEIVSLMKKMWYLTWNKKTPNQKRTSTDMSAPPYTIPFISEPQHKYRTPLLTLPLISRCGDPSHNHILQTLLSTGIIYSGSLSDPAITFPTPLNDKSFQELCTAFGKCSDDNFWAVNPGILLWVLLVGTAVARGKKEAAFWMFYLSRTSSFANAENWLAGNLAIRKFLEIQSGLKSASG